MSVQLRAVISPAFVSQHFAVINSTASKMVLEFSEVKASIPPTYTDTPFPTPSRQLEGEYGKPLVARLSFPLVGSVIPESLCEGAKWSSRRQNVGSLQVVSPAGEGGAPSSPRKGENKHGAETRAQQQIPADEYS